MPQTLWLWLDTFQGETAHSDDVRKLAKSLNVDTNDFKRMGLLSTEKDIFVLRPPQTVDLRLLARRLRGEEAPRGRGAREADVWEERTFPGFVGAAAWNAIAAPPGTPQAITSRLNEEINAVLGMPEIAAHFRELHLVRMGGSRADMAEFVNAERRRWEDVIRSTNVTLE